MVQLKRIRNIASLALFSLNAAALFPLFSQAGQPVNIGSVPGLRCAAALQTGHWVNHFIINKESVHIKAEDLPPGMTREEMIALIRATKEAHPDIHFLNIQNPTPEQVKAALASSKNEAGVIYGPVANTWHADRPTEAELAESNGYIIPAMMKKAGLRAGEKARKARNAYDFLIANLTPKILNLGDPAKFAEAEALYAEWYEVYKEIVLSKPNGTAAAKPTLADNFGGGGVSLAGANKANFWFVPLLNKEGKVIGGGLYQYYPEGNIFKDKFVANLRTKDGVDYSRNDLSTGALEFALRHVAPKETKVFSYGSDGSIIGPEGAQITDLSLARRKINWGFSVVWHQDPTVALIGAKRLLIILQPLDYDFMWISGFKPDGHGGFTNNIAINQFGPTPENLQPALINRRDLRVEAINEFVWTPAGP